VELISVPGSAAPPPTGRSITPASTKASTCATTARRTAWNMTSAWRRTPIRLRSGRAWAARALRLAANGDLSLAVAGDRVINWARPVAYQIARDGRRVSVDVRYRLLGYDAFGFALGRYNHVRPLVIDPVLSYSTFFGYNDAVTGVALDSSGNTYIAGYTNAAIITSTRMLQLAHAPGLTPDAFVAKLSADNHRLVYSTFVGGGGQDVATGIAVDGQGNAYVAGYTNSGLAVTQPPFPVTDHAFQVEVTLDVRNAVPPPPAVKGAKGPKAPKLGALLYRKTVHGMADSYGLYQGVLHLKYVTAAPVAADVRVQARSGRANAASTVPIQVTP